MAVSSPIYKHEDMWNWWGGPFDPLGFSLNDANKAIRKLR